MKSKWMVWAIGSVAALGVLLVVMFRPFDLDHWPLERTVFLPGETTDGHYQIELACDACHSEAFGDEVSMQAACVECHGDELRRADDSHPQRKFTDPRNADRVASLDARWCVTCHQEHRPELTSSMGLSLPGDYCHRCHEGIGEERPTHAELAFDGCAASGCHNFHDNRALYEDFLVEHRDDAWLADTPRVPPRAARAESGVSGTPLRPLAEGDQDAPADVAAASDLGPAIAQWQASGHARAGVNCSDCHAPDASAWVQRPPIAICGECHELEQQGFGASRHGMRRAAGLPPMRPALARQPMQADAAERELDCDSCHPAHAWDTRAAAALACLDCHADRHSLAWTDSPHAEAWRAETRGEAPAGSGVSCATCHLPRVDDLDAERAVRVAHNQNDYLRPGDKMVRSSCLGCHGLGFALDALADPALVAGNFRGRPTKGVDSIHFAAELRWQLEGRQPPWRAETPVTNHASEKESDE